MEGHANVSLEEVQGGRTYFPARAVGGKFEQPEMTKGCSVAVLRGLIGVLLRLDPAIWFAVDLRSRSVVSWIPVALLVTLFVFAAGQCLVAGNLPAAAFLSVIALTGVVVKLRATAHRQA
jgi:hypothetical protein